MKYIVLQNKEVVAAYNDLKSARTRAKELALQDEKSSYRVYEFKSGFKVSKLVTEESTIKENDNEG
jgi:hypothetical protein